MRKPWEVIAELESTDSRLVKESIIEVDAIQGNDIFFAGARLALDPMVTFGLKQVPEKKEPGHCPGGILWETFKELAEQLANRELTGNNARAVVEETMNRATQEQWNGWYRRILIKDLRCGVSEKTVNKVVEKINDRYTIPTFSCQLSHDSANHEGKVAGRKLVEVKLDGVRVITVVYPDGRVLQFSRNGKELLNFDHIRAQFSLVSSELTHPMVFDGEVMSSSFQDLMKQVHRKENVAAGDAVLHLFDMLTLDEFNAGRCPMSQRDRSTTLNIWYHQNREQLPNVAVVGSQEIDLDSPAGRALFRGINQQAIDLGYEGIMIKDPAAPYECKRTASWLKMKPFIEVSLTVVDFEEGTGRNAGRLGAIICEGEDDGRRIRVNVGSGFSDSDRDSYWAGRQEMVNQIVEVRADVITQNQDGSYSLRFPRFLRFRGFAPGEKI